MDYKKETEKIVNFIQEYFQKAGFTKAVLGISGGLDSAVVCALLVKALGKENVYGYSLPCGEQHDILDAEKVAKKYGINYSTLNIEPAVESLKDVIQYDTEDLISEGNLKARVRMTVLYDLSAFNNALVVGTGNKTELQLGYFTHYGDGACAFEPIGHLYKTQVKELAKYLGVPQSIIDKSPSAGLWDQQTDEQELGATYEEIDKHLKICNSFLNTDFSVLDSTEYMDSVLYRKIIDRIEKNKFKSQPPAQMEE